MHFVTVFLILAGIACSRAGGPGPGSGVITGPTEPPRPCPAALSCAGKAHGQYYVDETDPRCFYTCMESHPGKPLEVSGCQCCGDGLVYSPRCYQCLNHINDPCYSFPTKPAPTTSACPLYMCNEVKHLEQFNIPDPYNSAQYIACYKGKGIACMPCPPGLVFEAETFCCNWPK